MAKRKRQKATGSNFQYPSTHENVGSYHGSVTESPIGRPDTPEHYSGSAQEQARADFAVQAGRRNRKR